MGSQFPPQSVTKGFINFIRRLLHLRNAAELETKKTAEHEFHLEPKYWPEVREFIDTLNHIIKNHTIEEPNIQYINQRIIDYVIEQINVKGALDDVTERYNALNELSDRILANNLSKIVGLKHDMGTNPEFSHAVEEFKQKLMMRRQAETEHRTIS